MSGTFNDGETRQSLDCRIRTQRDRISALTAELAAISSSADELANLLREQWKAPDKDAITLYCASLLAGFAAQWKQNPPPNGFVTALEFPGCGKLEINIRRVEGKTAAESIRALTAEVERLREALEQVEWSSFVLDDEGCVISYLCPLCDQIKEKGHSPDCLVGAALGRQA